MNTFCILEDGVTWTGDGETLQIQAWGPNSLRTRAVMGGPIRETDFSLLAPPAANVNVEVDGDTATVTNGKITAKLTSRTEFIGALGYEIHRCEVEYLDDSGQLLLKELGEGGSLQLRPRHFKATAGSGYEMVASFEAPEDEKLYGMGQYQQETFDLKGSTLELAHRNSQASVPFVLSSAGYGFLWHNPAIGTATFGLNRTVWTSESTDQLDYWITAGSTPSEIAEAYADATGHTPTMPDYGLGYWQCKLRYFTQDQLMEVAREHKRRDIPLDVIVADFFHWPKMGDFRFDEEFWPDPQAMVDELKEMGVELMVSVWPQISHESENFGEMTANNFTVKTLRGLDVQMAFQGPSVFADMTNPEAREYVWEKCKANYYDKGIRVFWLDEAEPEYGIYDYDNYRYYQGTDLEIGNIYPQAYARAFYEGQVKEGMGEVVNLLRCAWSGSQRFGALAWSGDIHSTYEDFRRQIVAGLHMGIAGIPWYTTDIGGFYGGDIEDPAFHELLVRWFQFGAFSPVMRMHGYREPRTPILDAAGFDRCDTGADNEVWSFGEDVEEILVKYIRLRERLRPYMRSTMDDVRDEGGPVMRPVFYEFPEDSATWDIADQYMLGEDLLVAPVVQAGAMSREVYLPEGTSWRSLVDDSVHEGGVTIEVDAPLDVIPVFARGDALADLRL